MTMVYVSTGLDACLVIQSPASKMVSRTLRMKMLPIGVAVTKNRMVFHISGRPPLEWDEDLYRRQEDVPMVDEKSRLRATCSCLMP